ncbi:hypothetical protein DFQ27_001475 [Actinomortierella ambigua]|uniref:J domain-containing protein n=1 Tax=Actinomortierella ambigua TaxID=1343610 RepID=A0A9P6QK11_9FUNG|nr:hypothetical protein DFQ27_001475 [Actinomortierella ambigua]
MEYANYLGWLFLPSFATNVLHSVYRSVKYPVDSRAKPTPGSAKYVQMNNRIYCFVIVAYLLYSVLDVYQNLAPNYYNVLDIDFHQFSPKLLKKNFRMASLMHHPDKAGVDGDHVFVLLREAHDVLNDPVARIAYNKFGPAIAHCSACKTTKDYVIAGISSLYNFHVGTLIVLVLMSVFGKAQLGRYWRFLTLLGMAALELTMVVRSEPMWAMSWIFPNRVTFEQVAILHQIYVTVFIAIAQIGPILVPTRGNRMDEIRDLADRNEMLTVLMHHESLQQMASTFDIYKNDAESYTRLKNQMGKMALDSRLMADQLKNEAQSATSRRQRKDKNA